MDLLKVKLTEILMDLPKDSGRDSLMEKPKVKYWHSVIAMD